MTAASTPATLLEDDLKQLRKKLEHVPPEQWEACGFDVRTIRTVEDGGFAVADCTNSPRSGDDTSALARYIAACHPERIARLLAHIDARAEQLKSIEQAIADPENQPSQYGTVTLDFHLEKIKGWEDRFHRLSDLFDAQAVRLDAAEKYKTSFRVLLAVTSEKNRMNDALTLACSYLTDEQVKEVAAAMPPQDGEQLEALAQDSKRLDWLETQKAAYGFQDIHEGNRWEVFGAYATVREAIDTQRAAIASEAEP